MTAVLLQIWLFLKIMGMVLPVVLLACFAVIGAMVYFSDKYTPITIGDYDLLYTSKSEPASRVITLYHKGLFFKSRASHPFVVGTLCGASQEIKRKFTGGDIPWRKLMKR